MRSYLGIQIMTIPASCLKFVIFLYSFLKVFILMILELGVVPYFFGWVLDLYGVGLFGRNWESHEYHMKHDQLVYHLSHWAVGISFLIYLAKIISVVRSVVRPHVLWFLMNVEDPNFHPIRLMLNNSMAWHFRRIGRSFVMYSLFLLFVMGVPVLIWSDMFPTLVPLSVPEKSIISMVPFETLYHLAYIQYVLQRLNFGHRLKTAVHRWFQNVGELLDLEDYLLPVEGEEVDGQAPVVKPPNFRVRVAALVMLFLITMMMIHSFIVLVPLMMGHFIFGLVKIQFNNDLHVITHGAFITFLFADIVRYSLDDLRQARMMQLVGRFQGIVSKFLKTAFFMFTCVVLVPMLVGSLVYLSFVRSIYALHLQPFMHMLSYWVLGIVTINLTFILLLFGPESWRAFVEEIGQCINGNLPFRRTLQNVVLPVLVSLLLLVCFPYSASHHASMWFELSYTQSLMLQRYSHPAMAVLAALVLMHWHLPAFFRHLHDDIRDRMYLRGRQLLNSI
eukprot:TRINITY_DN2298_c0_g1_i4.p1 TRINITY_DN2298_c0_g1~~TRINITY_DN2298_c0_g1_i4.p1  ORF type:complete len:504 (+),score=52.20 TRINITY_DN2298_c0_g1_i4:226-1737(+)